ncbi:MAG: efflux RND transporter permease subunit [Proteobacteria bacterium]|nr:efflux RND transporter permease subunit [Pseudomonadota bacterium]
MDIAHWSIDKPVNTWLIVLACLIGGLYGLTSIGRLEDPAFTIKEARVITSYPGATAFEVEEEVTERLESAIQQMPQLEKVTSTSRPGVSVIAVEIKSTFDGTRLPQVWDELRRRIGDTQASLPAGARESVVHDDFGDVYGLFYAVTAPGYTDRELHEIAKEIRRRLLRVKGVAKVALAGALEQRIVIEASQERLATLGLSIEQTTRSINVENSVQTTGALRVGDERVEIPVSSAFDGIATLEANLLGAPGSTAIITLGDVADISLQSEDQPSHMIRFNGERAITLGVSAVPNVNIVDVGAAVSTRLEELSAALPVGVDIHAIYNQAAVVDEAVNGFLVNLGLSVAIVITVLCLFMGWRAGLVVGAVLFLTVSGTVFLMKLGGIELERISLGALIIAMGMLVDNAIVVAEGMLVGMQRGGKVRDVASIVVRQTQVPLLGATVIGIMAFSGIGLSQDITGEFLFSLFAVICISLLLSWVLAVTVTPLFGHYLLKSSGKVSRDPYRGIFYRAYRGMLRGALHIRWISLLALILTTAACFYGFGFVKQGFFPNSNTPMFYVHYWLPQGSDIRAVGRDMAVAERFVLELEGVTDVSTFIGRGASRFMLTYSPASTNSAYGHMIVSAETRDKIDGIVPQVQEAFAERLPHAQVYTDRIVFGPDRGAKIEARFSGPDTVVLRQLGEQAQAIMAGNDAAVDIRTDWRNREIVLQPLLSEDRLEVAGVSRRDIAQSIQFVTDGIEVGRYRDGDETLPIILRAVQDERGDLGTLPDRLVWSSARQAYVPFSGLLERFDTVARETLVKRRHRERTLTVQAEPAPGLTFAEAFKELRPLIEKMTLPPGYALEWGGEFENTAKAQAALGAQAPIGYLVMILITILLFGTVREPLLIWLIVPMSVNGVAIGLLVTGLPFTFTALLGVLSLSGMLIKNAIVLVEEIDLHLNDGKEPYLALVDASVSRLRPVVLAAGTTILGMAPLIFDAFFDSMAVAIMGGLAFATILTMIAVPVLYSLFYGIKEARSEMEEPLEGPPADLRVVAS